MAHISSLGAGIYTYLDIFTGDVSGGYATATLAAAEFVGTAPGTADADHVRMPSVREFPSVGTPANIVNVPVFGQATSSQVQGQSDAPSLEVTVNFVAEDMNTDIYPLLGQQSLFRFMMANKAITLDEGSEDSTGWTSWASGGGENTCFYFVGKIEAILVNPALTDATTATVTLSAQSDFLGPQSN